MSFNTLLTLATDPTLDQARRAADAGWETARWTWWLFFATILLVVGAAAAAIYAKRTWDAASDEHEKREAVNVSGWLGFDATKKKISLFVRNGNGGPVYDIDCKLWAKVSQNGQAPTVEIYRWKPWALSPAAAGISRDHREDFYPQGYVLSHTHLGVQYTENGSPDVKMAKEDWKIWDGGADSTGLAVELTFRDSRGLYWRRDWRGRLAKHAKGTQKLAAPIQR